MIRFENTYYLYGLLLIPFFILIFILLIQWRKKAIKSFGEISIVEKLMPDVSGGRPKFKFALLCLAYIFLVIGIANPQIGSKLEKAHRKGVDLVIALDISNSMLARDIKPNRLERAKNAIYKLINNLHNDRIGVVVFAGKAFTQLPITTDYAAAKMFTHTISTNTIASQGTAIGAAIQQAENAFDEQESKNKALIIITDGENHEDDAITIAKAAKEKGIYIHTIGMGSPTGAPIPLSVHQNRFKKDKEGSTIVTRLNETMLRQLAAAGGGKYIRATNTNIGLGKLFDEINNMEKTEFESKVFADYEDRFQYFIAIALLLLLIEIVIFEKKSKWSNKINPFKSF